MLGAAHLCFSLFIWWRALRSPPLPASWIRAGCLPTGLTGCSAGIVNFASDGRNRDAQYARDSVNSGRSSTSLLALDVRQGRLSHSHLPGEVGLVPAVFLAQAANGSAVLAESSPRHP